MGERRIFCGACKFTHFFKIRNQVQTSNLKLKLGFLFRVARLKNVANNLKILFIRRY